MVAQTSGTPTETGLGSALHRLGEAVWVGVLTLLCSLPLVTMIAAQSAAFVALDPDLAGQPGLTGRYWSAFRERVRPALPTQLVALGVGSVMVVDLAYGAALGSGSAGGMIFSLVGATGLVLLVLLRSAVASTLAEGGSRGLRTVLRRAVVLAGGSPGATLLAALGDVAVVGTAFVALGFVPFVVGPVLLGQAALLRRSARVVQRSAAISA